ncbi:MAG: Ig-like domain-containing protein, partial [Thermoplasmata archaeon]
TIVKKKISVTIANPISSSPPSGVSITSAPITSGLGIVQATATSAARVELLVDNVYVSDMVWNDATERYETLLNTLNYNDGTHQLRVRAINPVGESSAYQFITLDNWDDLTDTRIVKPSAGEAVNHSYNVLSNFMGRDKAWAMFNSSIPYPGFCEIYVDGMLTAVQYEESEIIPGEEFGYSLTINTVWFDDGQHTLKSVVYGPEGTSLFDIILFNIVNKPTLQILSPASGEVISGSNYELSLMAEDPNGDAIVSAQYRIDGGPWFAMSYSGTSSIYVATLDTTLISDGYHTIQFQVTDECSSVSVSQVTVNVDNVVLSSVSITSPSIGETISNFYPVKAHAEPASQCKYAELYVDEIYCGFDNTLDINGDFEFNLSTIGFSDGLHSIKVIVYDPYGNLVVDTKTITFSNMPTIMLISPTNGSVIGGTSHLEILTTDNDGISTAQFRIDTGTWIDMMLTGGPVTYVASYNLNTLQVSNGTHNLEFRVIDGGGFPDIASYINLEITIDNVLPTMCEIVSPLQNEYISGQYTFQIKAVDNLGISMVGVSLSGMGTFYPTYNSVTGFYEITRNTLPYPDGTYTASAFVKDYAGNTYSSSAVTFYIDNNAPVLNVQSPVEGAILSGAVMIETNVLDTFVHSVEYNVDGSGWVEITTAWNTLGVADGHHTVTIRALDNLLHETRTSVNVIVDNNNPQCGIISPVNNQFIEGILTVRVIA